MGNFQVTSYMCNWDPQRKGDAEKWVEEVLDESKLSENLWAYRSKQSMKHKHKKREADDTEERYNQIP